MIIITSKPQDLTHRIHINGIYVPTTKEALYVGRNYPKLYLFGALIYNMFIADNKFRGNNIFAIIITTLYED